MSKKESQHKSEKFGKLGKFGKWQKLSGDWITPGGEPVYVCGKCGGSEHLYGIEFRKRKMVCDECGSINSYPWEETIEQDGEGM